MQTKQTITIIGASGNIGSFMAKSLSGGNNRLLLCTDGHKKTEKLLQRIKSFSPQADAEIAVCPFDASWESDIIIVAVPFEAQEEIAERIRAVANQKIVISLAVIGDKVSNGISISGDSHSADVLQKLLPNSKIISVVITGFEGDITSPESIGQQIDAFIAGDDKVALEAIADLLRTASVNPILPGSLLLKQNI